MLDIGGPLNGNGDRLETSRTTWKSGGLQKTLRKTDEWNAVIAIGAKSKSITLVNAENGGDPWHTPNTCWQPRRRQTEKVKE